MERLGVNLIQDKIEVKESFIENLLKQPGMPKTKVSYRNPMYEISKDYYLDFNEKTMNVLDKELKVIDTVDYSQIKHVAVSMCSRWPSIRYNRYQVDLDIYLNESQMKFEIFNPYHFLDVIKRFEVNQIEIVDMVGIVKLFKQYPNYDHLGDYLGKHFNEIAKKYGLEHPRTK